MTEVDEAKHLLLDHSCSNCIYMTWSGKIITVSCILDEDFFNYEHLLCKEYCNESISKHSQFLKEAPLKIMNKTDMELFTKVVDKFRDSI